MKKISRGFILILLILASIAILAACSKDKPVNQNMDKQETEVTLSPEDKEEEPLKDNSTDDNTSTDTTENTDNEEQNMDSEDEDSDKEETVTELQEIRDITSVELVKEIKIGWNLGNTMDATGGVEIMSEISWGNPFTTKEMIDAVKEAGFNTLRIPTTWEKHLGPAPDYTINQEWLDRVQEIVDYAYDNEMFVIINMHHEEWHFPSYDNKDQAIDILTKVWKQIADRFEGYDEHLIFEGLNEPRKKGTNVEWNGGDEEGWDVVNQFNAAFIETIRNAGGNNPLRHLMIPTYAASSSTRAWGSFVVPEDDKVIVSIHAYTPYNFALNKVGTSVWSLDNASDTWEIDNLMNSLDNQFISKGIPVIIGEFGAMNKENTESRVAWAEYYIKRAKEKGIPCIWWDNGAFVGSGELFGLLDRYNCTWKSPEVVEALMKGLQ